MHLDDYSAEAALLQPEQYRRQFTLFKPTHFISPVVYPTTRIQFPKLAIYHHVQTDGVNTGPDRADILYQRIPGVLFIDHVTTYSAPIGNPIKAPGANKDMLITEYRRQNRAIRPLKNIERLERDDRTLLIFNYSLLAHLVRYGMSFRAGYYRWHNIYSEVWDNVERLAKVSNRAQFLELQLPELMPGITTLRNYGNQLNSTVLEQIRTQEEFNIADLFTWAGKLRNKSLLGKVDPDYYSKINFIVRRFDKWVVINLAWLDSFRINLDVGREQGMDPTMFQLRLLKLLNTLHGMMSPVQVVEQAGEDVKEETDFTAPIDEEFLDNLVEEEVKFPTDDIDIQQLEKELEELEAIREEASTVEAVDEDGERIERKLIDIQPMAGPTAAQDTRTAIVKKADELSAKGLITPAAYRRLLRISSTSKTLKDPYGETESLVEASTITDNDVIIKPEQLTTDPVVLDKSLTYSRVDAMDRQYNERVFRKDVLRSVLAIEKAPVAITDYKVERKIDAMNEQEIHSIKLAPAVGSPSTIRLPIPIVRPDGTFKYNGTEYRMRKQRAD